MTNYRVDSSFPASKMVRVKEDDAKIEHVYSYADIIGGDSEGTTDTDYPTHGIKGQGYSTINRK